MDALSGVLVGLLMGSVLGRRGAAILIACFGMLMIANRGLPDPDALWVAVSERWKAVVDALPL